MGRVPKSDPMSGAMSTIAIQGKNKGNDKKSNFKENMEEKFIVPHHLFWQGAVTKGLRTTAREKRG